MANGLQPILSALFLAHTVFAANSTESPSFDFDPYLQYRPAFARSLPVQILLTGVVLTLVAVLFIHLIFTAQYHWPLAPVNYVLQISGVTTLLISLIATLHVVLSATLEESRKWPYMLSYIAVNIPPLDMGEGSPAWSVAERATWLVMNASTSGLIQITHIQFLTLLYPSRLEGRLIFCLLGPLAIVAAIMQLLPIHGGSKVNDIASAVRNVCNATLSLLFTVALFIWGLLVNRKQAWRTDGGTAAFGAAALVLALVSTALNFLYVPREEEYVWLPGLMWAVVLWQSFLGWWWWVGAGSGGGSSSWDDKDGADEMARREMRERRRKAKVERRRETRARARQVLQGFTGSFGRSRRQTGEDDGQSNDARQHSRSHSCSPPASPTIHTFPHSPVPSAAQFSSSTYSLTSAQTYATLPRILPNVIHRWYANLRQAHVTAARQQAVERVERIRELERAGNNRNAHRETLGWGLGSFAWRIGRERSRNPELSDDLHLQDISEASKRRHRDHDSDDGQHPQNQAEGDVSLTANEEVSIVAATAIHTSPRQTTLPETRPRSMWWWGPLARWRLQDSTLY